MVCIFRIFFVEHSLGNGGLISIMKIIIYIMSLIMVELFYRFWCFVWVLFRLYYFPYHFTNLGLTLPFSSFPACHIPASLFHVLLGYIFYFFSILTEYILFVFLLQLPLLTCPLHLSYPSSIIYSTDLLLHSFYLIRVSLLSYKRILSVCVLIC